MSGDARDRFEIRPDPRRYRRHAVGAAPLVAVTVGLVGARLAAEFGWLSVPATLTLFGPPALLAWAYARRHSRTVSLVLTPGGLTLTDWRGRRRTLEHPAAALYCTIYSGGGRMEHIAVGGPLSETPLLLRTRQWQPGDLDALWHRLGIEPVADDLMAVPGVRARFPGIPLPYATRYPMTTGLLAVAAAFGYIALVVSLFRALA